MYLFHDLSLSKFVISGQFRIQIQNAVSSSILHGLTWNLKYKSQYIWCRSLYHNIKLFKTPVFDNKRLIYKFKQQPVIAQWHWMAWNCACIPLRVWGWFEPHSNSWELLRWDGITWLSLGFIQCNSWHKLQCVSNQPQTLEHLNDTYGKVNAVSGYSVPLCICWPCKSPSHCQKWFLKSLITMVWVPRLHTQGLIV